MSDAISGLTGSAIGFALDGLSLRHEAIAANIANANTPGYERLEVHFEDRLARLLAGAQFDPKSAADQLKTISPDLMVGPPPGGLGARASAEADLVELNRNVIQYEALVTGLSKYMSTIALALNEGRR